MMEGIRIGFVIEENSAYGFATVAIMELQAQNELFFSLPADSFLASISTLFSALPSHDRNENKE